MRTSWFLVRPVSPQVQGTRRRSLSRHRIAARRIMALALLPALLGGCRQFATPMADVELQQSLYDLQDLIAGMQDDVMQLRGSVDSLQAVVAAQDSVLRRVANLVGMPQPARVP